MPTSSSANGASIYYKGHFGDMRLVPALPLLLLIASSLSCSDEGLPPREAEVFLNPTPRLTETPTALTSPSSSPLIAPLTLDGVFPPRDLSSLGLDTSRVRTVIATGDVIPARFVDVRIRERGDDFLFTVEATKHITADADITVINLEAPLIETCPYHDVGFLFCGRPGFTAALQAAGVDVATLENNHIANYGRPGIEETVAHLESAGILWVDRDNPAIVDVRGLRFGFLAFNAVGEILDRPAMVQRISALRPIVDVLAVSYHWGAEYVSLPSVAPGIADDNPVEIAHLAVDAGADLVIGNHPHWVQAVEIYNGGFITYAHGNFIFDQMWSYETRVGVIGRYTFYDDRLVGVDFVPVLIHQHAQPVPMESAEGQAVLDGMKAASEELAAALARAGVQP
jgi:poly-gamma-glutamate synthesis protein (capsule biosynthesis protein)